MKRSVWQIKYCFFCLVLGFLSCDYEKNPVDLILYNGNIVTVDDYIPVVRALAAGGGKILAIGTDDKIKSMAGTETKMINLEGKTAIPG